MPPKKGGKGKGGKKGKEEKDKLTQVDRTFYELTITDLNNKLAHLRSHLAKVEDSNEELTEKMRSMNEDRNDVTAHLDRTLTEKVEVIHELDERLRELSKLRDSEILAFNERIKEWELKHKAMNEQLTSEIKLLNGKLNSLEEFRVQRDLLLAKFDEQEQNLKDIQQMHKESVYAMDQKAIIEKDALKKEVENKLLHLSEDFTRSSEIRNAGYTRRLIRENISLTKEIDSLILSQLRMMQEHGEAMEKAKRMDAEHATNEEMKHRLILNCQNKIEIIEKITTSYESLKAKFVNMQKYRKLYENSVKRDICEKFTFNDLVNKLRILKKRVETLKNEKLKLITMHQQHEVEIMNLREIIKGIRVAVQATIEEKESGEGSKRKNLLCELIGILVSYTETVAEDQSVQTLSSEISTYRPGTMGFLPRSATSLLDIFKREAHKVASAERISPEFKQKQLDGKITPRPRDVSDHKMLDVEYGSTYYMSSTADDLDMPIEEQKEDEDGGDYSSSTGESVQSAQKSKGSSQLTLKEPSVQSIERSVSAQIIPEEEEYDYEEEEEEDSINLFY